MPDLNDQINGWFAGRLPKDWFTSVPEITTDHDEILVIGSLASPDVPASATAETKAAAQDGRIDSFRENTREARMRIAEEAETLFRRKVSWGARCGDSGKLFAHLSVPIMTRLRVQERTVLDTLVDAGVARTRSDALAWCVRLIASKEEEWLRDLRKAFVEVEKVRSKGPTIV